MNIKEIWRRRAIVFAQAAILTLAGVAMQGCSVVMESTRPTPIDLSQFQPGETRDSIVERVGAPLSTANESDGSSCDFYNLYTHGYGAAGKVGIAVLEGAADVFTLGIAEAVTTPVEGATRNQTYPVTFCYRDSRLARVSESGELVAGSAPASETAKASTGSPTASTATAPPAGAPYDVPIPARMLSAGTANHPSETTAAPTTETAVETGAQPSNGIRMQTVSATTAVQH